jgi:hypothetical protein
MDHDTALLADVCATDWQLATARLICRATLLDPQQCVAVRELLGGTAGRPCGQRGLDVLRGVRALAAPRVLDYEQASLLLFYVFRTAVGHAATTPSDKIVQRRAA